MANVLGVAVARHAKAGFPVRTLGLQGGQPRLILYGSVETHGWAQKAAELLGLGDSSYRRIPADRSHRIRIDALRRAIREDRAAGLRPFCVIGTAGTVNIGATDDLEALAGICRREDLWFHVDGAFGALLRLSERLAPLVSGIEQADSLGFDLHKWGYLPFECACLLVRDAALHHDAFATAPAYLASATRGVIAGGLPFADRGIDLTRGFKALKVWLSLKAYGVDRLARLIEQNVRQAAYLAARVEAHPDLQLLAPAVLNIVCFRCRPSSSAMAESELNALNEEILLRIQEAGIAVPSSTVLDGRYAIRVCIVNHRTRRPDLDALLDAVLRIGAAAKRDAEGGAGPGPA
jgi:glutamate/tyrosine decarboxylase-like PLP-dependent enzyme